MVFWVFPGFGYGLWLCGCHKMSTSESLVKCFFNKLDENTYECKCKVKLIQKKGTGYSNLRQHVHNQHKDYENQINQYEQNSKLSFIPSNSAKKVYNWKISNDLRIPLI